MADSPPSVPDLIKTIADLKKRLARLRTQSVGPLSITRRFAQMQKQHDNLVKRVRRLEGTDSPNTDSP